MNILIRISDNLLYKSVDVLIEITLDVNIANSKCFQFHTEIKSLITEFISTCFICN